MIIRRVVVVILISSMMCACRGNIKPAPPWVSSLEVDTACPSPCWRGILLGQTGMQAGLHVIESSNDILTGSLKISKGSFSYSSDCRWEFTDGSVGAFFTDTYKSTIGSIRFSFPLDHNVHLGTIVELLGDPDRLTLGCIEGFCMFHINYPMRGLVIDLEYGYITEEQIKVGAEIYKDTRVVGINLVQKDNEDEALNPTGVSNSWDWKGYGVYPISPCWTDPELCPFFPSSNLFLDSGIQKMYSNPVQE